MWILVCSATLYDCLPVNIKLSGFTFSVCLEKLKYIFIWIQEKERHIPQCSAHMCIKAKIKFRKGDMSDFCCCMYHTHICMVFTHISTEEETAGNSSCLLKVRWSCIRKGKRPKYWGTVLAFLHLLDGVWHCPTVPHSNR